MSGLSLKEICFVSIIGGEERGEKVFPTDYGSFHLPGNGRAIQTFSTSTTVTTSSSLATSLLPLVVKVLQYSTSTDHPVAVLARPLTK